MLKIIFHKKVAIKNVVYSTQACKLCLLMYVFYRWRRLFTKINQTSCSKNGFQMANSDLVSAKWWQMGI